MDIKLAPNNSQLEIYLLNCLINKMVWFDWISDKLFYSKDLVNIFKKIKELNEKWLEFESDLILRDSNISESVLRVVIDTFYLWDIQNVIKELKELAVARYIYKVCNNWIINIFSKNWYDVKEDIIKQLEKIEWTSKELDISDFAIEYLQSLDWLAKYYNTWYYKLDEKIKLKSWQLIFVAGRPWMWKTTVMQNMALRQSKDKKVLFISLEMTGIELVERFVCMTSWKSIDDISKLDNTWLISEKLSELLENQLRIKDNVYTMQNIEDVIRQHKVKDWLDIVYVDYLWLIQWTKKTIIENLTEITKSLKRIAKKYKIILVVWSQLNRDVEKRMDKEPQLSDLRDSWSIEQDADIVLMLHREDYYDEYTDNKNKITILIRKNRNWKVWKVLMDTDLSCFRIN